MKSAVSLGLTFLLCAAAGWFIGGHWTTESPTGSEASPISLAVSAGNRCEPQPMTGQETDRPARLQVSALLACEESLYFALNGENRLQLFLGPPSRQQAVATFFRMDLRRLRHSVPSEMVDTLRSGIRISDLDEYDSVLSTYTPFAVSE